MTKNAHFFAIFTLFFGIFAIFNVFSYNDVSAASLELTVPTNFNIDLDPGIGTTFGESDSQQISIKTSGSFGYTLNIKPGSDTNLKNGNNVIKTITKTEGYDSGDDYKNSDEVNTWAYKPSKLNSLDNTKYLPFPSIETLLDKTDKNNDTANTYDLTIAAKVDNTLPSGKYSNNFVISATANTVSYSITYNLNEGEWSGESPQVGTTTENKIKLDPNKPAREDYEFLGWCSEATSDENCNEETKQPGDEITLTNSDNQFTFHAIWKSECGENEYCIRYEMNGGSPAIAEQRGNQTSGNVKLDPTWPSREDYGFIGWCTESTTTWPCSGDAYAPDNNYPLENGKEITLYAMWVPVSGNMQNFNCNSLSQNQVAALKDTRDDNIYTVAKLKDDKCWMTENLRIVGRTINSNDSDVSGSFSIPEDNSSNWSSDSRATVHLHQEKPNYIGAHYNWYAATAGAGTRSLSQSAGTANTSICPKGWTLPSKTVAEGLVKMYDYYTFQKPPANFVRGCTYNGNNNYGYCIEDDVIIQNGGYTAPGNGNNAYHNGVYYTSTGYYSQSSSTYARANVIAIWFGNPNNYKNPYITVSSYNAASEGYSVRCVNK